MRRWYRARNEDEKVGVPEQAFFFSSFSFAVGGEEKRRESPRIQHGWAAIFRAVCNRQYSNSKIIQCLVPHLEALTWLHHISASKILRQSM